jgi:hydroxybutyrate-dimer hydrolase
METIAPCHASPSDHAAPRARELRRGAALLVLAVVCTACATTAQVPAEPTMFEHPRQTTHRDDDDLLTAGLGIDGLRAMVPPAFADADNPTPDEVRRRAIWSNWRGIADLSPGGGFGDVYGHVGAVPGREFSAYATVPGAGHPHRVMLQLPDSFDAGKRCVLVTAASGSRGIHGAIAVAGAWGLPRGCAVAATDKGAGTDWFDLDAGIGVRADGTPGNVEAGDLAFVPHAAAGASGIAFKHAHSQDNPEADWGRHVRQAAEFALSTLDSAYPGAAPFTFGNTRIIAVGISNGGGAVLRAAELEGDWLDAVVAAEPNIHAEGRGSRALFDYTTEAALLMPCALLDVDGLPQPPLAAQVATPWAQRCTSLRALGLVDGSDTAAQARDARARMRAGGWTDQALRAGALSAGFDLWRAVAATYAAAYGSYPAGAHPCGMGFAAAEGGTARPASAAARAAWWSDASGIPPGAGVALLDPAQAPPDPTLPGLRCLRALWDGEGEAATRVRAGVAATRAALPRPGLPIVVIHGLDDGLVPVAFSSAPYVTAAREAGRPVRYWQVRNAQHFDAFLALPEYGARYVPLLPYVYAALDRVAEHLDAGAPLPPDAVVDARPRGAGAALTSGQLAIPR